MGFAEHDCVRLISGGGLLSLRSAKCQLLSAGIAKETADVKVAVLEYRTRNRRPAAAFGPRRSVADHFAIGIRRKFTKKYEAHSNRINFVQASCLAHR
jgi:hypothetical protein